MATSLNQSTPGRDIGYGVEQVLVKTIGTTEIAPATPIIVGGLPTGALVTGGQVSIATAFNAGTSAVLNIGYSDATSSATSAYASAISVATAGTIQFDELSTSAALPLTRPTVVMANYTGVGSAASAGSAIVMLRFVAV